VCRVCELCGVCVMWSGMSGVCSLVRVNYSDCLACCALRLCMYFVCVCLDVICFLLSCLVCLYVFSGIQCGLWLFVISCELVWWYLLLV